VLIVLPPSEGKLAPARGKSLDLSTLSLPGLTPARTRVLVDQIASLTDGSAVAWHGRLVRTSRGAGA